MSNIIRLGGGGADVSGVTAGAGDVLTGKVVVDANGNSIAGTMPNNGAVNQPLAINGIYTIPAGYHNGSGKITQSIPTKAAATIIPSTSNQIIASGQYLSGDQIVSGDASLVAANIKKDVNIFGVVGTYTGDGPRFLYNAGNEYTALTGGWNLWTNNSAKATLTKNSDSILMKILSGSIASGVYPTNSIDITNYSVLGLQYTLTGGRSDVTGRFGLVSDPSFNGWVGSGSVIAYISTPIADTKIVLLDVSAINSSYYVSTYNNADSGEINLTIKKIWLQ